MSIVRFNPYIGMGTVARRFNNFFNSIEPSFEIELGSFAPKVDISEDEHKIYINAEIAGLSKDDIKVTVNDDNIITIKGTKKKESEKDENKEGLVYHRVERSYGEFSRSFVLPENVSKDSVHAKFEDGLLKISLDKIEPAKPKEIEIGIK